jgi:hypothetical protein
MKRDMDLIRDVLLKVESDPAMNGSQFMRYDTSYFPQHSQEEITYHIDLLFEAGLVKGSRSLNPVPAISTLTWQGHEFLDDIRDPGIWDKVKEQAKVLPGISVAFAWEIAKAEVRKRLHLP